MLQVSPSCCKLAWASALATECWVKAGSPWWARLCCVSLQVFAMMDKGKVLEWLGQACLDSDRGSLSSPSLPLLRLPPSAQLVHLATKVGTHHRGTERRSIARSDRRRYSSKREAEFTARNRNEYNHCQSQR